MGHRKVTADGMRFSGSTVLPITGPDSIVEKAVVVRSQLNQNTNGNLFDRLSEVAQKTTILVPNQISERSQDSQEIDNPVHALDSCYRLGIKRSQGATHGLTLRCVCGGLSVCLSVCPWTERNRKTHFFSDEQGLCMYPRFHTIFHQTVLFCVLFSYFRSTTRWTVWTTDWRAVWSNPCTFRIQAPVLKL